MIVSGISEKAGTKISVSRIRKNLWTILVYLLLVVVLIASVAIHPSYNSFDFQTLALGALPLALAGLGQSIIVFGGGIDLSLGPLMTVANALSARAMQHQTFEQAIGTALLVIIIVALASMINGLLVVVTQIPDIIVTLATSFVWSGVALFILSAPGGGAPSAFQDIATGAFISGWVPNALLIMVVVTFIFWALLRFTRIGLSIFAVGSDRQAAIRSGVGIARAKIASYLVGGVLIANAGIALTMTTGVGTPTSGSLYTLSSLAVVVLGGVSLTGGKGNLWGPLAGALILTQLPTDFVFLGVDPNYAQAIQGAILVVVIMLGGLYTLRRKRLHGQ